MFRFVILLVVLLASVSAFAPARFGRAQVNKFFLKKNNNNYD